MITGEQRRARQMRKAIVLARRQAIKLKSIPIIFITVFRFWMIIIQMLYNDEIEKMITESKN